MPMTPEQVSLPPPFPDIAGATAVAMPYKTPARFRSRPMLLLSAMLAAAAADCAFFADPSFTDGWGGYGFAIGIVLAVMAVSAMRRDLKWKSAALGALGLSAIASAWIGCGISIILAFILLPGWSTSPSVASETEEAATPSFISGLFSWIRALADAVASAYRRVLPGRIGAWLAGGGVLLGFLWLLSSGNLALAKYVGDFWTLLGNWLHFTAQDFARLCLWMAAIMMPGFCAAAHRKTEPRIFVTPAAKPVPMTVAIMVGANLAFLASNLTDTWWIGVMHRAPDGVDFTEYLRSGTYALMADAAVAALLLLATFRDGAPARVSKTGKALGILLLAQCVWLGLGVAGRVVMQVDRLGFTPNRIWICIILAWGYSGLFGAWHYLRIRPSVRKFATHAFVSAVAILSIVQFRPPAMLSVDLNIAGLKSHPQWKFDDAYYCRVDTEALRILDAQDATDAEKARVTVLIDSRKDRVATPGVEPDWRVRTFHGVTPSLVRPGASD